MRFEEISGKPIESAALEGTRYWEPGKGRGPGRTHRNITGCEYEAEKSPWHFEACIFPTDKPHAKTSILPDEVNI